jgi:beta-lactamase regulating signal transducer with metallopeptidase domain
LIGLGIVVVVIGAMLKYAVTVTTTGFNINAVGVILLVVGIISVVNGAAVFVAGSNRRAISRESVQYTPNGQERVMEHRDGLIS